VGAETGREVLLTGATGFIGKVVLEALLRRREELGVARVIALIRPGAGVPARERFAAEVERSPCFAALPADWSRLVDVVEGDVTQPGCGLAAESREALAARVTHILHAAASVEFDLPVREAEAVNVGGCLALLELARAAARLERMVSVSTAYVTPHPGEGVPVRERLAPLPRPASQIRDEILAGRADERALLRETGHPNTYTLTKCLAEHLLVERRGAVPLSIVRPSVVSASWREPFPGWIDSGAAFAGFVALTGSGHLRAVVARPESRIDLVPVDVVMAHILAAAFEPAPGDDVPISHAVAGLERSPTIRECRDWLVGFFRLHPVDRRPAVPYLGPPGLGFALADGVHHGLAIRLSGIVSGRARRAGRKGLERIRELNRAFPYFTTNSFDFRSERPAADAPDAREYVEVVCRGIHRHLLRRDRREVPLAGRRGPAHGGDLRFALRQPEGTALLRTAGWLITKVLRRSCDLVTFDLESFERARRAVPEGTRMVLAPSHRSYLDFVLCSYLCFARPDLGIAIPHVAAAVEFSRIPLLGRIFRSLRAFYLERGIGREDKNLTSQVQALVAAGHVLEFFIEGKRSRTRRFLEPKRGFLRSLQATGERFAILPIAFSYDRVPEEATFLRELSGEEKPSMTLSGLLGWTLRMLRGRVALGRVHIACGAPVALDLSCDPHAVAREVIEELQAATVATTFHLRAFLARARPAGISARRLAEAIRQRGGRVIESSLEGADDLDPRIEASLRNHFAHYFHAEARRELGEHSAVARQLAPLRAVGLETQTEGVPSAVLDALFAPILRDYERAARAAVNGVASPRELLRSEPDSQLDSLEAAFEDLARRGVLERRGDGYVAGPQLAELAQLRALYAGSEARPEVSP
jgi:nucleoside-diphosphate-sugar epimerase